MCQIGRPSHVLRVDDGDLAVLLLGEEEDGVEEGGLVVAPFVREHDDVGVVGGVRAQDLQEST